MSCPLNPRQLRFIDEYLVDLNGHRAAKAAGYKGSYDALCVTASKLLSHPKVGEAIKTKASERSQRTQVTADVVLLELLALARVDLAKAYDTGGRLLPIHEIPEEVRRAIAGIEVFEEFEGVGEERTQIGETRKVKFYDKTKALELLGRHLKLFVDKVEVHVTSELGDRLAAAQSRLHKRSQPTPPSTPGA